ncbi:MAG: hypothetical protein CVT96_01000 [Bacteroidetes bacterium HGW-Bacteroidetes-13]|nr:MAG: hypothetical protein CVT96_01000 [Bacteroidetes bacterium HGW-Bacteroidetes-13]
MSENTVTHSTFELVIKLVEVIIWPLCLFVILLIYKHHFAKAFQRLGSIKADATGISMVFDQKIEAAKKLAQQIVPKQMQKSGTDIQVDDENLNRHPYEQLKHLQFELENKLKSFAKTYNIPFSNLNPIQLSNKLKEIGVISIQNAKLIESFFDIADTADRHITPKQLIDCKTIYDSIQL